MVFRGTNPSTNKGISRLVRLIVAVVTAIAMSVVALAATPASASGGAPTSHAKAAPTKPVNRAHEAPVRPACAATNKRGYVRCFALIRTDIKAHAAAPNFTPDGYGPGDLQSAYSLPSATQGGGQTVAIVDAFDDPAAEADLAVYRSQYGLPACTSDTGCFTKVNQDGNAGPYPPEDAGWATEISLDLDMVSAACPNCKILLVEGDDNSFDSLATAVDTAVALGAKYVSNSYGGSEDPSETAYDAFYDHPGVAVTASTGDGGYGTEYPATAPGVTAIGGTSLTTDSSTARGWTESAWDGAGSGCSSVEPKPDFQTDPDCANRSIADVSAVADPNTGVAVYDSIPFEGVGWQVYGGTSASSPLVASVYALAGTPVSGTNPESYPYARTGQLNDVTSGSNGSCGGSYLCTAGPGYDGPTGLGTPNGVAAFSTGPHGTISGTVTDAGTSDPIAGAQVSAGPATAVTDASGNYTLSEPVGTYDVTAEAYGYKSQTVSGVVVTENATVDTDFALASVPKVQLSGTIVDGSGHGWPLYAKITIAGVPGAPFYSNPFTGHYSVSLPSQHSYTMTIEPVEPGYQAATATVKLGKRNATRNIKVLVDTTACDAPGYAAHYAGSVEHFDDTTIPSTWTVKDDNGSGGVWVADDPGGRGNLTGGTGNFAIIDSDYLGTDATQDTELISPVVDLSNQASPEVGLNTDYKSFFNSVADIDYTIDGGATWTNVWEATDTDVQGPLEIPLPGAAHQSAVQVRFHYTGSFSYYWEVDDVFIGTKTCDPVSGGLVAGYTHDALLKKPLVGVTVASNAVPTDAGISQATPDDAARPDGLYWLFSSKTGKHRFTASKSRYTSVTKLVNVAPDYVTRKDFSLGAGRVEADPGSLSATVTLGNSANTSFTLTNTGTAPAHVKIDEQGGGFVIAGRPAARVYRTMKGAPTQHISGHFSPGRMTTGRATSAPAERPADAPWTAIADLPVGLTSNSAAYGDGKLYSVGGYDGNGDVASLYAYDPDTTSWTQLADMPQTREAPNVAYVGGKLYVAGGWGPDGNPESETDVYDPASDSWTQLADNPTPFAASGTAVMGSTIYYTGGCDAEACGETTVEAYDTSSDSWSAAPDYPELTSWDSCGGIGGQIYCAGGTAGNSSSTSTYGFDGSSWTKLADMPADDWGAAYSAANGQLVVSGGVINQFSTITNEGWSYDPSADAWTSLPNANDAVYRLGGACGFYAVGGATGPFDPPKASVEQLPGYDSCGSSQDVPWLSEDTTETDLAPGASATIGVTMDSADLAQPGTYTASLSFETDTPYKVSPVAITFVVNPPKTWGKVYGVVTGKACDGTSTPLAGATVEIDSWAAQYTLTTDKDGKYALWLDKRSNPLQVIVAKDGWAPQTVKVRVTPGAPLLKNFSLRPAKACS